MHQLDVWLFSNLVGSLIFNNGKLSFTYATEWLENPNAQSISCSLPLQTDTFDELIARPFFAGLLPEGQMRELLARQYRISNQNDFALLDEIGGECAGAVTFVKTGSTPTLRTSDIPEVYWLNDNELLSTLEDLPKRPMLAGTDDIRLSLAGAQSKLPVVFDGNRVGIPKNNTPSTHILKPAIDTVADSVTNEAYCMRLAKTIGLNTAAVSVHKVKDIDCLLVERYDRIPTENGFTRIHQEDFCQAMAVPPETKYQSEGGPDFAQCFTLLREVTKPSAVHVLTLIDAAFLNVVIGNNDAHGKNFSLLYSADYSTNCPALAPLYDILSTAIYPELNDKMAMKIGSKNNFDRLLPRHWSQFSQAANINEALLKKRLHKLVTNLPDKARELQSKTDDISFNKPVVSSIIALVNNRCETILARFANSQA